MNKLKISVKNSFRTEMIAAGLYAVLAHQYGKKNPEIGKRFSKASEEEHMHGKLFRQYFRNKFNEDAGNEKIWISAGKIAGVVMMLIPLKKKLKNLSIKESDAVKKIEYLISGNSDASFIKILKRILPDEVSHAAIYGEVFK